MLYRYFYFMVEVRGRRCSNSKGSKRWEDYRSFLNISAACCRYFEVVVLSRYTRVDNAASNCLTRTVKQAKVFQFFRCRQICQTTFSLGPENIVRSRYRDTILRICTYVCIQGTFTRWDTFNSFLALFASESFFSIWGEPLHTRGHEKHASSTR